MKIAFIPGSFCPDRCGVSHYTLRLAAELQRRRVDPVFVTNREVAAAHHRSNIIAGTPGWDARMLIALPLTIRRLNPDIVHIQHAAGSYGFRRSVFGLLPALRIAGWQGPVVVTAHEYGWWEWRPRLLHWAWRRLGPWGESRALWDREDITLLTSADAVIVTNEGAERALVARVPQITQRVYRIPIGSNVGVRATDVLSARQVVRARYGWPQDTPLISYFGFLHPVKGLETLLSAFRRLHSTEPRARLLINGGFESLALRGAEASRYEAHLRALISGLGLASVVHLTGYLPEDIVSQNLAGSDIGVLPFNAGVTLKSGSLLALWEHSIPVVATCAPTNSELGDAVLPVPCRDPEALAAGLLRLLSEPELRATLAARGRRAVSAMAWPMIAAHHLDIYHRLLRRRR